MGQPRRAQEVERVGRSHHECHTSLIELCRFESNSFLGTQKLNFTANEPRWHEKPIEKTFHTYVEDYLTGDEEPTTVTRPVSSAKPKQTLETGEKGQPMLPANCLIRHGDHAHFLNYQKQVLRSYVERMYSGSSYPLVSSLS